MYVCMYVCIRTWLWFRFFLGFQIDGLATSACHAISNHGSDNLLYHTTASCCYCNT